MRRLSAALVALLLTPASLSAQEDGQLRLMREPHSYVDVADAADGEDPFDLNVRVGFRHEQIFGAIQREPGAIGVSGDPEPRVAKLGHRRAPQPDAEPPRPPPSPSTSGSSGTSRSTRACRSS